MVGVHGAAPPEWGVAIPIPGDPAFPSLLLPPGIFDHASALRLAVRRAGADPVLFLALGTSTGDAGAELRELGFDAPPCKILLVCDARWRPLWRAALERGRFGVAARGSNAVRACGIDDRTRSILAAFVAAADEAKAGRMNRFEEERARWSAALAGKEHPEAVLGLRALEESWAREILGLPTAGTLHDQAQERLPVLAPEAARDALAHLKAAEERQWEIGTWSTSGGEGIASMVEVHTLKLAQAWLCLALGDAGRASTLTEEVASDPNNLGEEFFKKALADLRLRSRTSAR
jgi:hypothetical protein